ncbi:MAG: hypothetical protein ACPG5B_09435 [Chitinophagales bacterium]
MQKQLWRNRWLSCLNELTSIELQKTSWLDKSTTNPHWSYVEFMCSYFDDLAIDNNYEEQLKNGYISKEEYLIIKDWHIKLDNYNEPNGDCDNREAILKDKKWLRIVNEGFEIRKKMENFLNSKEIEILNKNSEYK